MAISSPLNLTAITKGVQGLGIAVTRAQVSAKKSANILLNRTKVKSKLVFGDRLLFQRQREVTRRKQQRELIQASSIGAFAVKQGKAVIDTTKGFLGRIMDFLGTLLLGWMLNNLPSIISMAQELMARIQRLVSILGGFVTNIGKSLLSFGNVLGAIGRNILEFDFFDTSKRVEYAMNDLNSVFDDMGKQISEGMKLFTTPLTEGLVSGEGAAPFGTDYTTQPGDTAGGVPSGLFELIAGGEGGYESMNRGDAGDSPDGAKKYLGKNLQDMTLSEIMVLQSQRKVFAVGKYQIVTGTMPGFVRWLQSKGYDPKTTKYSAKIQDLYPQYVVESKRPQVGKFLSGSMNDIQRANLELAAEFASVGVPFDMKAGSYGGGWPKRDIKKGESLYSGRGRNRASISPEQVQQALKQAKESRSNNVTSTPTPVTSSTPQRPKLDLKKLGFSVGERAGYSKSRGRPHRGRDIAIASGTPVSVITDATITDVGTERGYGYFVAYVDSKGIEHFYGHLRELPKVKKGQTFSAGTIIGYVGSTGRSTGPHLHWEVSPRMGEVGRPRKNIIDPIEYGFSSGAPFGGTTPMPEQIEKKPSTKRQQFFSQDTSTQIEKKPSANRQQLSSQVIPAQIETKPSTKRQQLSSQVTPERQGSQIILIDDTSSPLSTPQIPSTSSSGMMLPMVIGDSLNSLIKNRFLLDLAYT